MELKDTTQDMLSDDYKRRFLAEYNQLHIRIRHLSIMIDKWERKLLETSPTVSISIYKRQLSAMKEYREVLRLRAGLDDIEIGG